MDGSLSTFLGTHGFQTEWSDVPTSYVVRHDTRRCQLCTSHQHYSGISYASTSILDFGPVVPSQALLAALGLQTIREATAEECCKAVLRVLATAGIALNPWLCSETSYAELVTAGTQGLNDGTGTTVSHTEWMEKLNQMAGERELRAWHSYSCHPWCHLTTEKKIAPTLEWMVLSGMCMRRPQ